MSIRHLYFKQNLNIGLQQAWDFFSSPHYLNSITPDFFHVDITSQFPDKIYAGLLISYRMKVFFGIAMTWISEVTQCDEPHRFIYQQRIGPFLFFSHEVCLTEQENGVELQDYVCYVMPYWVAGRVLDRCFIGRRLRCIFACRAKKLEHQWGAE